MQLRAVGSILRSHLHLHLLGNGSSNGALYVDQVAKVSHVVRLRPKMRLIAHPMTAH